MFVDFYRLGILSTTRSTRRCLICLLFQTIPLPKRLITWSPRDGSLAWNLMRYTYITYLYFILLQVQYHDSDDVSIYTQTICRISDPTTPLFKPWTKSWWWSLMNCSYLIHVCLRFKNMVFNLCWRWAMFIVATTRCLVITTVDIGHCGSCQCLDALIHPRSWVRSMSARRLTQMPTFAVWPLTTSIRASACPSSFKNPNSNK